MKNRFLVFAFDSIRPDDFCPGIHNGGWNDLLEAYDIEAEAIAAASEKDKHGRALYDRTQVVDLQRLEVIAEFVRALPFP